MKVHGRLALAGCALIGLTACGSTVAAGSAHPDGARVSAGAPLCAAARRLDQLEIRLTVSQPREILPRALTSTDAPRVRALAAALCGLPPLPSGRNCPAALRGALLLVFAAPGRTFAPVRIQDSGCPSVTGIGATREWAWSSRPGQLLAGTVGGHGKLVPDTHPSSVPTGP